jgi:putative NADH-flavin reductase
VRLLIAGAGGRTGRLVVRLALDHGHDVTAFVHVASEAPAPHARLSVAVGDARDPAVVAPIVPDHDAIVSVLSHPGAAEVTVFSQGTRALADAAESAGVRRFVAVSAEPVGIDPARLPFAFQAVLLLPRLHVVYEDMARMERELVACDSLEWTIVRPAVLTTMPARGRYRTVTGDLVEGGVTLSRGDLAAFLLRVVEERLHVRERVAIAD